MRIWIMAISLLIVLFIASSLTTPDQPIDQSTALITAYFKKEASPFFADSRSLVLAIESIKRKQPSTVADARLALKKCRLQYKRLSFLLDYFFHSEALLFNAPPKYEIEEPYMEYQSPKGFQVIEALLYGRDPASSKTAMLQQARLVETAAADLPSLLYGFKTTNSQVLESVSLELIRVMTLYITGYDAPLLKSGLEESCKSLEAINTILAPYTSAYKQADRIRFYMDHAVAYLKSNPDFDGFNRLFFLTQYALPLQAAIHQMVYETGLQLSTVAALNKDAHDLFSADAIDKKAFPHTASNDDTVMTNLGRQLFSEKMLSGNQTRSCASCHSPSAYFADGLAKHSALDGKQLLPRNTMGLLYTCYQYAQFWDGRAKSLEDQVNIVVHNQQEMDGQEDTIVKRLAQRSYYTSAFEKVWPGTVDAISLTHIANAIAAYIRTLAPFHSAFDQYMQGEHTALTKAQQKGFNLFMGKAQCGTCHFAPLFNGLTPPFYDKTEYEVVGIPKFDGMRHPKADADKGRYSFFPISFYKQAFKTPTVRNAAMTAPYMHNGAFRSLESVVEFYNKGGGAGIGLNEPGQTLSAAPLKLTVYEKACLVTFMKALTDRP